MTEPQSDEQRAAQERAQVEQVFGLTGGELSDTVWEAREVGGSERVWTFHYFYESTPEYAERELDWTAHDFRTVVRDIVFGAPPEQLEGWTKVATFGSSGEVECPGRSEEPNIVRADQSPEGRGCYYCEAEVGEPHGYIYIGDGWAEIVYKRDEDEESAGS